MQILQEHKTTNLLIEKKIELKNLQEKKDINIKNKMSAMNTEMNTTNNTEVVLTKNQIAYQKRKAKLALEKVAIEFNIVSITAEEQKVNDETANIFASVDEVADDVSVAFDAVGEEEPQLNECEEEDEVFVEENTIQKTTTDSEDDDLKLSEMIEKRIAERKAKKMQEMKLSLYEEWRQNNAERVLKEWVKDQKQRVLMALQGDPRINERMVGIYYGCKENSDILTAIADDEEEENCPFLNDLVQKAYEATLKKPSKKEKKVKSNPNRKSQHYTHIMTGDVYPEKRKVLGERENQKIFKDGELLKHQIKGCIKLRGGEDAYNGNNVWTCRYRKEEDLFRCKVEGGGLLTERVEKMVKNLKKTYEGEWVVGRELNGVVFQFESLNQFASVHNALWRPNDPSSCESIWKGGNVRLVRQDGDNEFMDICNLPLLE